jgi:hypothetical protein
VRNYISQAIYSVFQSDDGYGYELSEESRGQAMRYISEFEILVHFSAEENTKIVTANSNKYKVHRKTEGEDGERRKRAYIFAVIIWP